MKGGSWITESISSVNIITNSLQSLKETSKKGKFLKKLWIRSDEGLALETSAFESLYGG